MAGNLVTGWIPVRFEDDDPVDEIRDRLYAWLDGPDAYTLERDPHLSLVGIAAPKAQMERIRADVEGVAPSSMRVPVDGYHLWPSSRNPMVVALDASVPMGEIVSPLADAVSARGGRIRWGPYSPHVTLFSGGKRGEELQWARVSQSVRRRLQAVADGGGPESVADPTFVLDAGSIAVEWH
ncbi:MAG: hypothetical protein PPP58_07390 [Natronomonas sp.]